MAFHHAVADSRYAGELAQGLKDGAKRAKRLERLISKGKDLRDTMATPGWIMLRKQSRDLRKNFQRTVVSLDFSDPKVQATQLRIRERELFFADCAEMVKSAKAAPKELQILAEKMETWDKALQGCRNL